MQPTFLWHDYETTGADPRRDRPAQFAAIRTTLDLEPMGEPESFFCQPAPDVLPHPEACLLTGITPQQMQREGLCEAEFAARVHALMSEPGTCSVGYNSIRFDDEVTRNLLYRNFFDPYAREWKDGNSRWDLIDLVRMCHALRPEGIEWPLREDGTPTFRLEDLARANRIEQAHAHDALSDVEATLGLARLIRSRQPRLWNWYYDLRRKQRVSGLVDLAHMAPLVHVSSRYPANRNCLAIIAPLAELPGRANAIITYDLAIDPTPLIELPPEEIEDRVFTSRDALPEGIERIPLKLIHANRSPALAPISVLRAADRQRLGLDLECAEAHRQRLVEARALLLPKLSAVFARGEHEPHGDAELALYDGFLPDADRPLLDAVRGTPAAELGSRRFPFRDLRYPELLFRYRARNWPETLDAAEAARWQQFRARRLQAETPATPLTLGNYFKLIAQLRISPDARPGRQTLLDSLEAWGHELARGLPQATTP